MLVFRFKSRHFDFSKDPKNSINPIYGYALGEHIRQKLIAQGFETTDEVEDEDWGWYFYVVLNQISYMIGTCAFVDEDEASGQPILGDEPIEMLVQFEKPRSLKEKIFGRNKFKDDDPIYDLVEKILRDSISDMSKFERE